MELVVDVSGESERGLFVGEKDEEDAQEDAEEESEGTGLNWEEGMGVRGERVG